MFSITVSRLSALVSWNVRTMPNLATLYAETLDSCWPLKVQLPLSGLSKPVSRLKKVVLPAPLGPMRAVITPRWISTWSTSTAVSPPNRRTTFSATSTGSGLGAPGSCATSASATAARLGSAGIESDLPPVAEDPLRSVDHQQHQRQSHDDEAHEARLGLVHHCLWDQAVVRVGGLVEEAAEQ